MNHTDFNQIERSKLIQTDHTRFILVRVKIKKSMSDLRGFI
jgi:hypothetical protein